MSSINIFRSLRRVLRGEWTNPVFVFFTLTLLVTGPLFLRRGFLFLLDWIPLPTTPFPREVGSSYFLFNVAWWFLGLIFSEGVLQKIFLGAIFFLAGFGMFRLIKKGVLRIGSWGAYWGGILYIFNPFVYSRVLVGHWTLLFAYALLPWLFLAVLQFFATPSLRRGVAVGLWWTAASITSPHVSVFILLLLFLTGLVALVSHQGRWQIIRGYGVVLMIFLLFNSHWIVPTLRGTSTAAEFVTHQISHRDIFSFFTRPDSKHGILWNTAAMYGFWGDEDQRYVSQKVIVPYWFYLLFPLLGFVIWGGVVSMLVTRYEVLRRRLNVYPEFLALWLPWVLVAVGLVTFFLAIGISFRPIQPFILWFYDRIPLFRGFREPHKFVALLAFVYAILGAIGVEDVVQRIDGIKRKACRWIRFFVPGLLLLIPLAYSPGMLRGFHGQLRPSRYPDAWFAVDHFLTSDPEDFRVLFLPWHEYVYLSFAHTVVVNPAGLFFHKPTIAGDNIEFGPIYTESVRPESKYIEREILEKKTTITTMGTALLPLRVKYVILAEESDFFYYTFIEKQKDLRLVFQADRMKVFQNLAW